MTEAPAARVVASKLTHRYGRRATGVCDLDFEFASPGAVAVTGPNGCGKSTLLRIVAGLLRPSSGTSTVQVGGRDHGPADRRHVLGLASPELSFYEEFTAESFIVQEDAMVLARCFERYGANEEALRRYERRRYQRTAMVSRYSRYYGRVGQWKNVCARGARRTALALVPESLAFRVMQIVFDYDATIVNVAK